MRPKPFDDSHTIHAGAYKAIDRTTTSSRLTLYPACACPRGTCSNSPLARAAAAAPCNSDSGLTFRTPRTAFSGCRAMTPDRVECKWPLPALLPARTSTECTEGGEYAE